MAASILYGTIEAYVHAGMSPSAALRFAGVGLVDQYLGTAALDSLGVPERTLRRWRSEFRQAVEALADVDLPEDPPEALVAKVAPTIAHASRPWWDQELPLAD